MKRLVVDRSDEWNARRTRILGVAAELFAARGVDAVSIRDVAAAAGLHVSTLYYYFPGKADVYKAATHWAFERISSAAMAALHLDGSATEKLRALTNAAVAFLIDDHVAARLLDHDFVFGTSLWDDAHYPPLTREPTTVLATVLQEMGSPLLAHMSAERLAEITWDIIYGIARFSPAHVRLMPASHAPFTTHNIAAEAWLVLQRVLFPTGDLSDSTDPNRRTS